MAELQSRSGFDLSLRETGAQAPAVALSADPLATQESVAFDVHRRAERGLPRCAILDDASRRRQCRALGVRPLLRVYQGLYRSGRQALHRPPESGMDRA